MKIGENKIKETEKILKAFANKRRLTIISLLKKRKESSVKNISTEIKLSFRSTSKHLSILYSADIVEKKHKGLMVFYSINSSLPKIAAKLISFL